MIQTAAAAPPVAPPAPTSMAANLKPLAEGGQAGVTLQAIVDRVEGASGLAPVVFVLTLPVLLPLPPGFSMVLAVPLLLAAGQMVVGRHDLWLPKALARQSIRRDRLKKGFDKILPWVERLEALTRPRLTFLTGRTGAFLVGLACLLMAVILVLPIPFANLFPALTVCLMSLAVTRRDGLGVLLSLALLAIAVTGAAWGLHGARLGLGMLRRVL